MFYYNFHHNVCRDVQQLAGSLAVMLSDPSRVCLLHEVCQLLPASDQAAFDRIAASVIAEGKVTSYICDVIDQPYMTV